MVDDTTMGKGLHGDLGVEVEGLTEVQRIELATRIAHYLSYQPGEEQAAQNQFICTPEKVMDVLVYESLPRDEEPSRRRLSHWILPEETLDMRLKLIHDVLYELDFHTIGGCARLLDHYGGLYSRNMDGFRSKEYGVSENPLVSRIVDAFGIVNTRRMHPYLNKTLPIPPERIQRQRKQLITGIASHLWEIYPHPFTEDTREAFNLVGNFSTSIEGSSREEYKRTLHSLLNAFIKLVPEEDNLDVEAFAVFAGIPIVLAKEAFDHAVHYHMIDSVGYVRRDQKTI